jgi:hypothetical protein
LVVWPSNVKVNAITEADKHVWLDNAESAVGASLDVNEHVEPHRQWKRLGVYYNDLNRRRGFGEITLDIARRKESKK